jgi:hypothetical protein
MRSARKLQVDLSALPRKTRGVLPFSARDSAQIWSTAGEHESTLRARTARISPVRESMGPATND